MNISKNSERGTSKILYDKVNGILFKKQEDNKVCL